MFYFIGGIIVGLLVNPFRNEAKNVFIGMKNGVVQPHATFSEPKEDINNVTKITEIIHE